MIELETYLARGCGIPANWFAFFIFTTALLFASLALIFLFVRSRMLAAEYSEKQVIITTENLKGSRSERIINSRIRTDDAYGYIDAKKQLHDPASYVSTLELLPFPELYANKDDQQNIFRRLVRRRLVVNNTAVAYEMNNRSRTTFLITDVPRINSKRIILAMAYPLIVAILTYLLQDTALHQSWDDSSTCRWLPKDITLRITVLLSCTTIVVALLYCREGILRSAQTK